MMTPIPAATADAPATAASSAVPLPGPSRTGTPAFDTILMLQNLAATTECLDTACLDAGETTDLIGADDSTDDEDNADELEASLAFLSQLLTVTQAGNPARDFESGAQSQDEGQQAALVVPLKTGDGALLEAANDSSMKGADAPEPLLTAVSAEPPESRSDASQNLVRAAEILAAGARPGAATHDKTTLSTPARDPRWADELGTRVSLMVRARESSASLQMTPADLGPVEVNVTVKDAQATVHFGASQAETRALLEASIPKLREMLAAQGFNLTDSSVSSGFARSQREDASPSRGAANEAETSTTEARPLRSLGLLDLYA
jgi:flagellar hook-length control protein FliK